MSLELWPQLAQVRIGLKLPAYSSEMNVAVFVWLGPNRPELNSITRFKESTAEWI